MQANTSSTRRAVGQAPDADPVVPLVEEVAGLLAPHDVGLERQPVLAERHRLAPAARRRARRRRTPGAGARAPRPSRRTIALRPGERRRAPSTTAPNVGQPGRRVGLDDERRVVAVDDQPGEARRSRRARRGSRSCASDAASVARRSSDAAIAVVPPVVVDRHRVAVVQDPDPDRRRRVVQPDRGEAPAVVEHDGEVARRAVVADRRHRARRRPTGGRRGPGAGRRP